MTDQHIHDPLQNHGPGCDQDHVSSYWAATAGEPPEDDGPVIADASVDVAVIGGGYTGLSCAYHLARDHGIEATVLEANRTGWGCSGRNGGHVRPSIGKMTHGEAIRKWGLGVARRVDDEIRAAMSTFLDVVAQSPIECELIEGGVIKVAHRPNRFHDLANDSRLLNETFGHQTELVPAEDARRRFMSGPEVHGALRYPDGVGIHALKLAHGLQALARNAGATVYPASEVAGWSKVDGGHRLSTPGGTITARRVVMASNGYTAERLHPAIKSRLLPVLSHIIVTRPLNAEEIAATAFATAMPVTDTRHINQYYRLLSDGRLLFGSRGAPNDNAASRVKQRQFLIDRLGTKFPPLAGIEVDYDWNGWVCLTYDWIPHISQAEDDPSVHYAMGYAGSGIAFAVHAGKRLAARIAGAEDDLPDLPTFTRRMPKYPFAQFRRLGLRLGIAWLQMQDNR